MILVIGETAEEYRKINGDEYRRVISGIGLKWASAIKGSYLLTVLSQDNAAHDTASILEERAIRYSALSSLLPSAVIAGADRHYKGSAPTTLSSEDILECTAGMTIDGVIISSVLLSYNPSSSAILDTVSFLVPQPKVAIDVSVEADDGKNMLAKAIGEARISFSSLLVSDSDDEIKRFLSIE